MQLLLRVFSLFPNGPPLSVSFELVSGGGKNEAAAASLFSFFFMVLRCLSLLNLSLVEV